MATKKLVRDPKDAERETPLSRILARAKLREKQAKQAKPPAKQVRVQPPDVEDTSGRQALERDIRTRKVYGEPERRVWRPSVRPSGPYTDASERAPEHRPEPLVGPVMHPADQLRNVAANEQGYTPEMHRTMKGTRTRIVPDTGQQFGGIYNYGSYPVSGGEPWQRLRAEHPDQFGEEPQDYPGLIFLVEQYGDNPNVLAHEQMHDYWIRQGWELDPQARDEFGRSFNRWANSSPPDSGLRQLRSGMSDMVRQGYYRPEDVPTETHAYLMQGDPRYGGAPPPMETWPEPIRRYYRGALSGVGEYGQSIPPAYMGNSWARERGW